MDKLFEPWLCCEEPEFQSLRGVHLIYGSARFAGSISIYTHRLSGHSIEIILIGFLMTVNWYRIPHITQSAAPAACAQEVYSEPTYFRREADVVEVSAISIPTISLV
jgi:hypothetical protein